MFKIMDDGLCADKDIAHIETAQEFVVQAIQDFHVGELPYTLIIKDQITGKVVETHQFSLQHEVTKHDQEG